VLNPELGAGPVRTIGARTFDFSRQVAVMAIVNRTRDSFHDRGATFAVDRAVEAVQRAVGLGADWVDVGGVPFSPIAEPVSEAEELDRVLPLVEAARSTGDVVVSVDTFRADVADAVLAAGADVVNDTSGLHDPRVAEVVAARGATLVVCHSKAAPRTPYPHPTYADVVAEVREVLLDRVAVAQAHGVPPERIVVDPGHDLNKNTLHSLELTRRLGELAVLGYPLMAAVSNKDFIQETLGVPSSEALVGTVATHVFCMLQGARILRVHDVLAAVQAVAMTESVLGWRDPMRLQHNL
jgi:dihydropteroate synthase